MFDLRLSDPDSTYTFAILRDYQWRTNRSMGRQGPPIVCSPTYLRFLLESRAPALPAWYSVGISGLYESSLFPELQPGVLFQAIVSTASKSSHENKIDGFEPDPWLSESAAMVLRSDAGAPRPLLPMREVFVPSIPVSKSEKYRRVWEAQSELFVRWAYSENVTGGKDRLRRFASAAAAQPVTEGLFQSCFGMNYADARDALSDYLPQAVLKPLQVPYVPIATPPPIAWREANPEEIRRIKGEWARRTLRVIKENYPSALPLYIEKTRKLLQRAYDLGQRDPQLLASLALFRIETGDPAGGCTILAEHPEAVAARPMARLALARLQLQDALEKPAGLNRNLSDAQAAGILEMLSVMLKQPPPIEGAYLLEARVLQHLGRGPTGPERACLNEGARFFPRNSQLAIDCVSWDLRAGDVSGARTLIEFALWESSDPSAKEKLSLLDNLARSAVPAHAEANQP